MSATRIRDLRVARIRFGFERDLADLPAPVRDAIEQDRANGLGWRYDGLNDWSTEDIFRKLQEEYIDTDPVRFREQAERAANVVVLASSWSGSMESTGPHAGFALAAAEELWYRLLPDIDCAEVATRHLDEAILAGSPDNIRVPTGEPERRNLWRAVAGFVSYIELGPPGSWPSRYAGAQACSPIDYEHVFLKLITQSNADELDEAKGPLAILMSSNPNPLTLGSIGIAYARVGRSNEAQAAVEQNLAQHPDSAWAHETAGEVHLLLGQAGQAIANFRSALSRAESGMEWGSLLDHMCTAVPTHAADPAIELTVSAALDRLADEVPPPDD
jgi:tetratricopeptide (TPR) repeat protein